MRLIAARKPVASSTSALRSAGTNRPSSVSTAMPMSTCGCSVRTSFSPSNHALSAGTSRQGGPIRAGGDFLFPDPLMEIRIVDERGRHDLRVRGGHHASHVAAYALELLGL